MIICIKVFTHYLYKRGELLKYCFIINPNAGKGQMAQGIADSARSAAEAKGVEYDIFMSYDVEDTKDYILRNAQDRDGEVEFIACGGDGTLCKTILAVMAVPENYRRGVCVGVVPIGTGYDFVSNFKDKNIFLDIEAQLDPIPYKIDLVKCNDVYSVNMVNVGFDSHVVCQKEKIGKKKWVPRKLAYIFSLVITLIKKPWLRVDVSFDGGESVRRELLLTTMANGAFCGGGFNSNPHASLVDGKIDFLTIENVGRIRFLTLVGKYKSGMHVTEKLAHIVGNSKCSTVDLCFDRETPISVDGELIRDTELHLSVEKDALTFMLPRGVAPAIAAKAKEAEPVSV